MTFKNAEELETYCLKNGYSKNKTDIYVDGFQRGANIYPYLNHDIKKGRLREIVQGLVHGLDVSWYDDYTIYHQDQMKEIRLGLMDGIDVSKYAKPDFDQWQMIVIRQGLLRGVDVSLYCDPKMSPKKMWQYYNRLITGNLKESIHCTGPNPSRFNLEEFKFQRVDFEAVIKGAKIISPYQYSLLFKEVYWQGEYICDHIWAGMNGKSKQSFTYKTEGFNFGDRVSFSAIVETYLHNKDGKIHFGLSEVQDLLVIESVDFIHNYQLGHILRQKIDGLEMNLKKYEQPSCEAYQSFCERVQETKVDEVDFKYVGYKKDRLIFDVLVNGKQLDVAGNYRPYWNKNKITIGDTYALSFSERETNKIYKLQNTFCIDKYVKNLCVASKTVDEN